MKHYLLWASLIAGFSVYAQTEFSQSSNQNIWVGNSAACTTSGPGTIHNNSFIRVFDTDDYNVQDTVFFVYIKLAVESTSGGSYDIIGRVHELNGTLQFGNMSLLAADTTAVYPDSTLYRMIIPIKDGYALPGDTLVAEVFTPLNASIIFFPGSNPYVESGPSYMAASGCGFFEPTTFSSIGYPQIKLLLSLWVNHKPVLNDFSVSVFKDNELAFLKSDFDNAMNDYDNDTVGMVRINTLPASGILKQDGIALNVGDTVYSDELALLTYMPNAGYSGNDAFDVQVRDAFHWSNTMTTIDITVINWQLGLNESLQQDMVIYPNPASSNITIQTPVATGDILVFDAVGALVKSHSLSSGSTLDVSELESGIYFVVLNSGSQVSVQQFVRE